MAETILVTGSTGKVGTEVVRHLAEQGFLVRAAARDVTKVAHRNMKGVEAMLFDFADPTSVRVALDGADRIYAIIPDYDQQALKVLLKEAQEAGIKQIVLSSLMNAEIEPTTVINEGAQEAERMIADSGLTYTFLRPNFFMQNFSSMDTIKNNGAIYLSAGDGKTSFIDVRDIAAIAAVVMKEPVHENQAYTLTGPEALDHYEVARTISEAIDKEVKYYPLSDADFRAALSQAGMPATGVEQLSALYQITAENLVGAVLPDAQELLKRPLITFEQFAHDYKQAWM